MLARAVTIRQTIEDDAAAIAEIYAHHVLHGTASYEVDPPSLDDMLAKIRQVTARNWPFIVAEAGSKIVGYAYATQFRDRAAYRFACEDSIYVDHEAMRCGVGRALLAELLERSAACGFKTMVAVIGGGEPASVALHRRFGFGEVGRLKAVGWKKDRWLDSVYMQRNLTDDGTRIAESTLPAEVERQPCDRNDELRPYRAADRALPAPREHDGGRRRAPRARSSCSRI